MNYATKLILLSWISGFCMGFLLCVILTSKGIL